MDTPGGMRSSIETVRRRRRRNGEDRKEGRKLHICWRTQWRRGMKKERSGTRKNRIRKTNNLKRGRKKTKEIER